MNMWKVISWYSKPSLPASSSDCGGTKARDGEEKKEDEDPRKDSECAHAASATRRHSNSTPENALVVTPVTAGAREVDIGSAGGAVQTDTDFNSDMHWL